MAGAFKCDRCGGLFELSQKVDMNKGLFGETAKGLDLRSWLVGAKVFWKKENADHVHGDGVREPELCKPCFKEQLERSVRVL